MNFDDSRTSNIHTVHYKLTVTERLGLCLVYQILPLKVKDQNFYLTSV